MGRERDFSQIPIIDVSELVAGGPGSRGVAESLGEACRESGFFYVVGHGVDVALQGRLRDLSRQFFAQDIEAKLAVRMALGGRAWRGYFRVGDTVRVHYKIVEGDKDRIQVFQGVVLKRHRAGARSTFTVRKVSFNVGVERQFLTHSPRIDKVEVISRGVVRRARLFYLRDLQGKAARVRDQKDA